ncbi:D-alanyl-D-alanine endopeptidase [Casimicrobium huifangae]|uniref:D-alanyl-D-alanine endopeptidase n=1 Tax=Casimicrobium huifangae TaxID=2591109 RepID=UPI001EE1D432|nr:D-alanyl-D-alanine endopeptidase [Casimicrobium huifangae]
MVFHCLRRGQYPVKLMCPMKNMTGRLVFVRFFAIAALSAVSALTSAVHAQGPNLLSQAALIVDARTGDPIFAKNANNVTPIASITKLMTAMVVLDAQQNLDQTLTVDLDDLDFLKASRSRLSIGSELTRREMLRLALMSSENRAASSLGRFYPGGLSAAVAAMNAKAKALGMNNTRYVDTTGLSPENVSTARDLAVMVQAAQRYPLIREFSTQPEEYVQIPATGKTLHFNNSNALVKSGGWDISLQKTGFIREAGRCVVMLAQIAQRPVVLVLLDSVGKFSRIGDAQRVKTWMETGEVLAIPKPQAARKGAKAGKNKAGKAVSKKKRR